jgi:hypothetical protein
MRAGELTAAGFAVTLAEHEATPVVQLADTLAAHVDMPAVRLADIAAAVAPAVDSAAAAMQVAAVATAAADTGKVERGSSHERPVCFCRRAFLLR